MPQGLKILETFLTWFGIFESYNLLVIVFVHYSNKILFLAIIVKELRVYKILKCIKNHCNHLFAQQCPYSYYCLLQRRRLMLKNNIANRYGKEISKKHINIKKINHSIKVFRCFDIFADIFESPNIFSLNIHIYNSRICLSYIHMLPQHH